MPTFNEKVDILIGVIYNMVDDTENKLLPAYRWTLETSLLELIASSPEPKAKAEYKNIATQYQVEVILSAKDSLEPKVVQAVQDIQAFLDTLKSTVWDKALEEIESGKSDNSTE